jgi:glutaminase
MSLFGRFSADMGLHVMEVPAAARAVVRSNHIVPSGPGEVRVLQLQGGIRFAGAERIDREVVDTAPSEPRVVFDLTMVSSIDDVARRMLLEVVRRLRVQGRDVYLVDPEAMIPDPDAGDGARLEVVDDLERAVSLPHEVVAHHGRPGTAKSTARTTSG